jgi:hypothetical protein
VNFAKTGPGRTIVEWMTEWGREKAQNGEYFLRFLRILAANFITFPRPGVEAWWMAANTCGTNFFVSGNKLQC